LDKPLDAACKPDSSGVFTGLRGTPSLCLIHDSAILKTMAFAPVTALFEIIGSTASLKSGRKRTQACVLLLRYH